MNSEPVVIAGGGIGGLAAALGLAGKGFAVTVLERAPALGEIGAGIQLGPNAFHATHEEVMAGFRVIHRKARAIIEHGREWKAWVICDRDPVERWVDGNVALLGDAAHPMLQYFAQGACMALEDAVCLAHEMAHQPEDLGSALESYRLNRVLRTARVQLGSRALGEHVYHPRGAHAALRDELLRQISDEDFYDGLAWLYGATGLGTAQHMAQAA